MSLDSSKASIRKVDALKPVEILVLVHYYGNYDGTVPSGTHERILLLQAMPTWSCVRDDLISMGLLSEYSTDYKITPRGRCLVEALCRVPLPTPIFVVEWPMQPLYGSRQDGQD